jgi:hypothetical protein
MTARQLLLVDAPRPALPAVVDLRLEGAFTMIASLDTASASLVVADPPWDQYGQRPGTVAPDGVYPLLRPDEIGALLSAAVRVLRPGGRLLLWTCWPLLVEALAQPHRPPWLAVKGLRWATGGAWSKEGPPGCGYHWRGASEPLLVAVRAGAAPGRPRCMVRSSYTSAPEAHSMKPVEWQRRLIKAYTDPGDLVVDLFAGLGSVALATLGAGEGRRYVGAELDPGRHLEAVDRVALWGRP